MNEELANYLQDLYARSGRLRTQIAAIARLMSAVQTQRELTLDLWEQVLVLIENAHKDSVEVNRALDSAALPGER